jgi:cob(II)yrinic acid a,c-diamide reductase
VNVLKHNEIGPHTYRNAMAQFAGAVHVVTTQGEAGLRGITIIAACSVSDAPATVLVSLNRENPNNDLFVRNGVFALNTLSVQHEPLAVAFSGLSGLAMQDRFGLGQWDTIATGAPTLADAAAVFDCLLIKSTPVATHRVLFGVVQGLRIGPQANPLVYFQRSYRNLDAPAARSSTVH